MEIMKCCCIKSSNGTVVVYEGGGCGCHVCGGWPVFTTLSITQHSFSALIMVSQGYFCIKTKLFVHHSLPWIISQLVKQML